MTRTLTSIAIVALLLGACSGGDASSSTAAPAARDAAVYDALVTSLDAEADLDDLPVDAGEAACIANATYDQIGTARWVEAGVDSGNPLPRTEMAANLTADEWDIVADAMFECVDVASDLTGQIVASGVPAPVAECALERWTQAGSLREAVGLRDPSDPRLSELLDELEQHAATCSEE